MMLRSDAPAMAALVACPALRDCPAYLEASKPARSTSFFTTRATSIPDSRPAFTCPCRLMERNTGPAVMAACSIHACIVRTGHVSGFDPYGIPILRPTPSWSTFDRQIGIRSIRNPNLAADAFLVHFRPPQRNRQAILAENAVVNVQPHQFRSAECSREP